MTMHGPWTSERRLKPDFGQRGSAAVEAAIVTTVVMALFFGVIELGFFFKDYLSVGAAVRSGVRIASASPRIVTFAQATADRVAKSGEAMDFSDVQELWVYKASITTDKPEGRSDFDSGCNTNTCVKFRWDAGLKQFVKLAGWDWPATSQNACSSSSVGGPPDRIGVFLKLRHDWFIKLDFKNYQNISEASIATLEPMPVSGGCK
jgi:Flp pilus assembly protein TadG